MIPVSTDYKRQLISGNRNYLIKVDVWLSGNTTNVPDFTLTNEEIWDNGIVIDEAISSDNSFDIGSAIVSSLTVVINNINGDYSGYDFFDAKLTLYLGVSGDVDENNVQRYYRKGFYIVDAPSYNGSLITLDCLDNMIWFDAPYSDVTGVAYPATAGAVVQAICDTVGVTLGTPSFPNYSLDATKVLEAPQNNLTCREVLQYVAQMCCCYCKINTAGQLVLTWYDKSLINNIIDYDGGTFSTTTTPYSDGCNLDGGHFNPWDGDNADGGTFSDLRDRVFISQNFEISVSTDDVVITGCRVRNNANDETGYDVTWVDSTLETTHDRYVLVIDDNPFITSEAKATTLANLVGSTLAGLPMRGFSATSLSDFSYETGDMATVVDFRGNRYYTWVTHFTFTTNNSENFSCGVESLKKRSEQRFSTVAESVKKAKMAISAYDTAVQNMNELAQNAIGYNKYVNAKDGKEITWLYNGSAIDTTIPSSPTFSDSTVVFMISGDGVFISNDGGTTYSQGYDANSGTAILSLLYAIGISCDWVKTGSLTLGGFNNLDGTLVAYANTSLSSGSYSATAVTQAIGYTQVQKVGETPVDIHISNISSLSDFKGRYRLYHTTDGATFTLVEENILSEGTNKVSTVLDIVNNGNYYYSLIIDQTTGGSATFDYSININKIVTTIDRNGIVTTAGVFSGQLSAATGTLSDGTGTLSLSGGDLHMTNAQSGGAGLFATKTGTNYYSCWGAINSAARDSGAYREVPTMDIIIAGDNASDERLKEDIKDIDVDFAKALILGIKPKSFRFKSVPSELDFGVIAQDVKEITENHKLDKNRLCYLREMDGMYAVDYQQFIAPMIKVIQQQQGQIDELKQELADLKARVK